MIDQIKITQRKFGRRTGFDFLPDRLVCTMRDTAGEFEFSVPYETIDVLAPTASIVHSNNGIIRTLAIIPFVIGAVAIILQMYAPAAAGPLLTVSLVLLALVWLSRFFQVFAVKYTSVPITRPPAGTSRKSIVIIKGKHHDAILDEIKKRWRTRLRDIYGSINFSVEPAKEIAKFNWLKDRGVISHEECREAIDKLQSFAVQNRPNLTEREEPEEGTLN
ncbi:MAG TPA: hypothetical protein VHQ39_09680 [Dongiaceae bacterium]|jgi:hypothetical protein|nr:hypothetical protein [Dongiaceae bacterium]